MTAPAKLHLTIDTLALAGFPPHTRDAIAAALQTELARHFATPETLAALGAGRALPGVRGAPFALGADTPRQVGAQAARALVDSVTRTSR